MKRVEDSTTLVIAGAWNPMVLQPPWVLARIPGLENQPDFPLSTEFGLGLVDDSPRFTFPGKLKYQVRRVSFLLGPEEFSREGFEVIQTTANRILRDLPHTPVSGVGFNFEFCTQNAERSLDQIRTSQQDIVAASPDGFRVVSNSIRTSLHLDDLLLNIQKEFQDGTLSLKFNFHMGVKDAAHAEAVLRRSMWDSYIAAERIAHEVFGEGLEDE